MNRFERDAWWTLISMVHYVPGTLTVNVSVLLLSLASPDESSLVIEHFSLDNHFITPKTRNKKTMHAWHIFTSLGHTRGAPKPLKYIINEFINDLSLPPVVFDRQKYEVEFLLQQQWYDPRLRYSNRSQYEFLNAIHHYDDIWLPDTYFIMHGDFKDPLIPVHFALRIYRNGTVNYLMRYCFIYF